MTKGHSRGWQIFVVAAVWTGIAIPARTQTPMQADGAVPAPVHLRVHAGSPTGKYTPIWNYFGADEPNYLYAPNGKKLLGELAALSSAPVYYRPHNLLTTGNGDGSLKWGSTNAYTERPDGTPVYDFTITDRIFDAMVAARVRPLVEIGFMPEALSAHPEPYRHSFPKGDIFTGWSYPPKDEAAWAKWSKLVAAYAAHLKARYGSQTGTWLWEVWNEPDIPYWHGTAAEYDRLYDMTAAAVRQVLPDMTSIDTGNISRDDGVEISGFIGFPTLRQVTLAIDYRDNLLHVTYDPKHDGFH